MRIRGPFKDLVIYHASNTRLLWTWYLQKCKWFYCIKYRSKYSFHRFKVKIKVIVRILKLIPVIRSWFQVNKSPDLHSLLLFLFATVFLSYLSASVFPKTLCEGFWPPKFLENKDCIPHISGFTSSFCKIENCLYFLYDGAISTHSWMDPPPHLNCGGNTVVFPWFRFSHPNFVWTIVVTVCIQYLC